MQTVIGAFDDRTAAQQAAERLVQAGFDRGDVHVEQGQQQAAGTAAGTGTHKRGFFASLFGDDDTTGRAGAYDEVVNRGSAVVVVDAHDDAQADRAAAALREAGAFDIDERAQQWRAQGGAGGQPLRQDLAGGTTADVGREGVLDVVQEELKVGKRATDRGGVRVIQRVSQTPVRELVRLREEHAVVERHAVDRPASPADLANFREGTLEVRETVEEPVVAKTARVVEEVRVGKEVREREETIEDTVRRKDVDVERLPGAARERAVASDDLREGTVANRDPDAQGGASLTGTRKGKKPL